MNKTYSDVGNIFPLRKAETELNLTNTVLGDFESDEYLFLIEKVIIYCNEGNRTRGYFLEVFFFFKYLLRGRQKKSKKNQTMEKNQIKAPQFLTILI